MSTSQGSQTDAVAPPDRSAEHGDGEAPTESHPRPAGSQPTPNPSSGETVNVPLTKTIMQAVYRQHLDGKTWEDLDPKITSTSISRDIVRGVIDVHRCIRDECRYKLVVETVMFKYESQLVNLGAKCLWDKDTDKLVHDSYVNGSVICNSQVFFSSYY